MVIFSGKGYFRVKINIKAVQEILNQGKNIPAVRAFREMLKALGYRAESLHDLGDFILDLRNGKEKEAAWRLTDETEDNLQVLILVRNP